MHAATTSLAPVNSTRGEWANFAAFLRRPALPERARALRLASLVAVWRMLLLDLAVMGVLLAIASAVIAVGVEVPQTALAGMEIGPGIVFAVVVFAPLAEEIAFRGWLSGRPGHLLGVLALLAAVAAAMALAGGSLERGAMHGAALAVVVGLLVALALVFALRKRGAMRWFTALFPALFWLSTLGFASVHLLNFPAAQMAMALPLILPQFATGMMLGYLRVHYGLWASILLHLLHNGAFLALVWLAGGAG
ncbi:MAG: CPBP family glutamic-type intramembrane protease [Erythrobacter sp.]